MAHSFFKDDSSEYLEVLGFATRAWGEIKQPMFQIPTMGTGLKHFHENLLSCRDCQLCDSRKRVITGEGASQARLMFVAEAPSELEEEHNHLFAGPSGELLLKMISAMGLSRSDIFITHAVKCKTPEARNPTHDETSSCLKHLKTQIEFINPEIIVMLGNFAAQTLLENDSKISDLRGQFYTRENIVRSSGEPILLMPTFHPSYLLREPSMKKPAWDDLQMVIKKLATAVAVEL